MKKYKESGKVRKWEGERPTFPLSHLLTFSLSLFFICQQSIAQIIAFPHAEGFGRLTAGGRGGAVIEVTNTNDSGPGSFREALNTPGPRTIVFRTGGIINLQSDLQLTEPYVTIAAQTAPGDGIVLKNFSLSVFTHDIIMRGMRLRPGDDANGASPNLRDCMSLEHGTYNMIVDHCSFSWGLDENVSAMGSTHHVTVQWCIISEGLFRNRHPKGPHSMGLLVFDSCTAISIHHNLLAHNNGRNPVIKSVVNNEFVNNVIYDWGYNSEFLEEGVQLKVDVAGNYWKPRSSSVDPDEFPLAVDFDSSTTHGSRLYIHDNIYLGKQFLTPAQISAFGGNAILFSDTSLLFTPSTVSVTAPMTAYDTILSYAGAVHPQRDVTDVRVLQDVRDSTGGLIDCMNAGDMLLDSGMVISATDTSLIYDQKLKNPAISPEARRIDIVAGKGAGQSRMGVDVGVIDSANRIIVAYIDAPWSVIPDSTSIYKVSATCDNHLNGYPAYAAGTAPSDLDHDGMPDNWETTHLLNPNDPADRNYIAPSGYTNLEVYLNSFYGGADSALAVRGVEDGVIMKIYPNPVAEVLEATVDGLPVGQAGLPFTNYASIEIYDALGRKVLPPIQAKGQVAVDVSGLERGIYIVVVDVGDRKFKARFVKI